MLVRCVARATCAMWQRMPVEKRGTSAIVSRDGMTEQHPRTRQRLAAQLFESSSTQRTFLEALSNPIDFVPALIWLRDRPSPLPFDAEVRLPWQPEFVDRVSFDQRPGRHPLHDAGAYYCLDMSSVFAATSVLGLAEVSTIVDVCAAPGGKTAFAWRAYRPQRLFANEVIGKRTGKLIANVRRCSLDGVSVTSMDVSRLAEAAPRCAELVIVDAPCSGQSLVAKGKPSPGCFHPATINKNANRQRRILAHAIQLVAPSGTLVYITCTYARKENEGPVAWVLKRFPAWSVEPIPSLESHRSHLADFPCYRLWPFEQIGAGAFVALLRAPDTGQATDLDVQTLRLLYPK